MDYRRNGTEVRHFQKLHLKTALFDIHEFLSQVRRAVLRLAELMIGRQSKFEGMCPGDLVHHGLLRVVLDD